MILEIAVFNLDAAVLASLSGADRIELCENPGEGGTTPSYGTLQMAREKIGIPVFPIIRPRGGDFLYGEDEYEVIKKDITLCKELGFEGVVTGALNADGSVATAQLRHWVDLAYPMEVTFHRAFDRCRDPLEALEEIIRSGCSRILTSGQLPEAIAGRDLIKQLVQQADDRIIIMPGSGIRSTNLKDLASYTGAKEFHSSARKTAASSMRYLPKNMQEELTTYTVDKEDIRRMKSILSGDEY